jgi:hypothetical protein
VSGCWFTPPGTVRESFPSHGSNLAKDRLVRVDLPPDGARFIIGMHRNPVRPLGTIRDVAVLAALLRTTVLGRNERKTSSAGVVQQRIASTFRTTSHPHSNQHLIGDHIRRRNFTRPGSLFRKPKRNISQARESRCFRHGVFTP